jgi:hypothetical protein
MLAASQMNVTGYSWNLGKKEQLLPKETLTIDHRESQEIGSGIAKAKYFGSTEEPRNILRRRIFLSGSVEIELLFLIPISQSSLHQPSALLTGLAQSLPSVLS